MDAGGAGRRFILLRPGKEDLQKTDRAHLAFIFNFFEEIRRLAPPGKN